MAQLRKPRILFTTWAGEQNIESPYSGKFCSGDKIAARVIAEGLAKRGLEVHFFNLADRNSDFKSRGVSVHLVKNHIQAPRAKWTPRQILKFVPQFFDLYVQHLVSCIRKYEIDLVMARTVHLSATGAHFAAEFTGKPLITTLAERDFLIFFERPDYPPHIPSGFDAGRYYLNYSSKRMPAFAGFNAEHRNRIKRLFENSSALISLSPHLFSDVRKITQRSAKQFVVPDGVAGNFFQKINSSKIRNELGWGKRKVVLCVARTSPYKRQDLLIRCWSRVLNENPDALLILVGNGPYYGSLVRLIKRNKLGKKVHMLGYQPHTRVRELTQAANVIASPTDSEGLPLTLLEAMAASKPVVTSRVEPYIKIIKNEKNGILVRNHEKDFARGINQVLRNPNLAKKIGRNAQKTAKFYSWKRTINLTEKVVRKVLS